MCDTDLFKPATPNTFCDNSRIRFVNRTFLYYILTWLRQSSSEGSVVRNK